MTPKTNPVAGDEGVTRYQPEWSDDISEQSDGHYVKYSDYQLLQQRAERMEEALKELIDIADGVAWSENTSAMDFAIDKGRQALSTNTKET